MIKYFIKLAISFLGVLLFGTVTALTLTGASGIYKEVYKQKISDERIPWGTVKKHGDSSYMKVKGGWQKIHYDRF